MFEDKLAVQWTINNIVQFILSLFQFSQQRCTTVGHKEPAIVQPNITHKV